MNFDFFSTTESFHDIDLPDTDCKLYPDFINIHDADTYLQELTQTVNWSQETIAMYGKVLNVPRLSAWYGEPNLSYEYSGIKSLSQFWLPQLQVIKNKIELLTKHSFNSVLINLYRDGNDSVDWHSDDEPELGLNPVIASVSFGEQRNFHLKNKFNKDIKKSILLPHGSLLLMSGTTQKNYQHKISKSKRQMKPRINLTFRDIQN
ncbi:MAG: alpha-ketoglutarate-dependent dioxygenase AlkB [Gammaproteobacteria bacterium]